MTAQTEFTTREAMARLTNLRPSQRDAWTHELEKLQDAGLHPSYLANSRTKATTGQILVVRHGEFRPGGKSTARGPGGGQPIRSGHVDADELRMLQSQSNRAVKSIAEWVLERGGLAPKTIDFYFYPDGALGVRQQSFYMADGSLTVLLKGKDAILNNRGQAGTMAANLTTSIAGSVAARGRTDTEKLEQFCRATAIHELGHMFHALSQPDVFMQSTIMPDPMRSGERLNQESKHVAEVNERVLAASNRVLGRAHQWKYASANPAEIVAEGFTAMVCGIPVPRAVAAVYIAYGGPRTVRIDGILGKSIGGRIPRIDQPEGAINQMT